MFSPLPCFPDMFSKFILKRRDEKVELQTSTVEEEKKLKISKIKKDNKRQRKKAQKENLRV
jgi:hypothetical protein